MKKLGILLCAGLLAASTPVWAQCEDGTVFNGKNSGRFCASNVTMNWWSAFSWCQAHNMDLATWEQACAGQVSMVVDNGYCCGNVVDFAGLGDGWLKRA